MRLILLALILLAPAAARAASPSSAPAGVTFADRTACLIFVRDHAELPPRARSTIMSSCAAYPPIAKK